MLCLAATVFFCVEFSNEQGVLAFPVEQVVIVFQVSCRFVRFEFCDDLGESFVPDGAVGRWDCLFNQRFIACYVFGALATRNFAFPFTLALSAKVQGVNHL